jgi:hypothetical protein
MPVADANGSGGTFCYTVSDGRGGTASQEIALNITPVNDAPIAVDDAVTTLAGESMLIAPATLLANDRDPEGEALQITAALLILGMSWKLYELKLRSNSYCYSAPPQGLSVCMQVP